MIRKIYEVDAMLCPGCGGTMKVIAFLTKTAVFDRIIDHHKLTFEGKNWGKTWGNHTYLPDFVFRV